MKTTGDTTLYTIATHLSKTARGGHVIASLAGTMCEADDKSQMLRMAIVGDHVVYPDGSTAEITSGAGNLLADNGLPIAIVGSHISGGDKIISSPVTAAKLRISASDDTTGFLIEGWRPENKEPA